MSWRNIRLIFHREVADQLRDRRTLFMVVVLPLLLYPALGVGMLQMSLLFSEQPRTVVILGAEDLPEPALLNETNTAIADRWFAIPEDSQKLNVVTDQVTPPNEQEISADVSQAPALDEASLEQLSERQLQLIAAEKIRTLLNEINALRAQLADETPDEQSSTTAELQSQIEVKKLAISDLFAAGNIQVLVIIPEGFSDFIDRENQRLVDRTESNTAPAIQAKRLTIVRNSANEKSAIAYGRVREALDAWELAILNDRLEMANLPTDLTSPVNAERVDLAKGEELAANVWSKLFPAMLIIMAMTGAFHPAIDLGAGEKERGTMETLLISPALRSEIVIGKFLTVLVFSLVTAVLNLASMGMTGLHILNTAGGGQMNAIGDFSIPGVNQLMWVVVLALPLASLFASLSLAFSLFARSSKEGQYYLTPLLTVTMGLTIFCLSPAVEITPFYCLMPIMGPALLLKGLLLGGATSANLLWYVLPVLSTSFLYSALGLIWAIDQFKREDVLFRESERFDLKLWFRHLFRDKEATPSFSEGLVCFVLIMLLQFLLLRVFGDALNAAPTDQRGLTMVRLLIVQQLVVIACPALLMGILLTKNVWQTFQFRLPAAKYWALGLLLPLVLHPLALELQFRLAWFFPALKKDTLEALAAMSDGSLPLGVILLAFALTPAICEELAFRGFIMSGFRQRGRDGLAILFSAILFGVMHMIPQQVFNAALLGLVLGLLAVKSGSIVPAILFHFVNNGLGVLHGNLEELRKTSPLVESITLNTEAGVRYPLWLVTTALILATWGIITLLKSPTPKWPETSQSDEEQFHSRD